MMGWNLSVAQSIELLENEVYIHEGVAFSTLQNGFYHQININIRLNDFGFVLYQFWSCGGGIVDGLE